MNNGPLWSKDDVGNYWLVFPNKHALSKDEIRDIFSKFGRVRNVTTAGNEKGLRFVQYSTLQDVENAVENLKNHPSVRLIPHRPKNKRNANSDEGSKDNFSNHDNSQQAVVNNKNDKRNLQNSCESISSNGNNKSIFEQLKNLKISSTDNVSICSSNVSNGDASFGGQSTGNKSSTESLETNSPPRINGSLSFLQKYKAFKNSRSSSFTSVESTSHDITDSHVAQDNVDDELPDLITKPKSKSKYQQKMVFLNAEEVIVGNIHNDYGCAYILHLFEKYEPLAVSYMLTVPKSKTRYCHVYFKTPQDSLKVETIFDKYNLSGQKLIVLRPCRLIEEKS